MNSKRTDRPESSNTYSEKKDEGTYYGSYSNVKRTAENTAATKSTTTTHPSAEDDFYLRYYVGHKSKEYGHEFMEFELSSSGRLRYANNSNYKSDSMIRKEVFVSPAVVEEFRRIIIQSEISKVNDENWDQDHHSHDDDQDEEGEEKERKHENDPRGKRSSHSKSRRQELEIKIGNEHLAFTCREIESLLDAQNSVDPKGLILFYYLANDLKCLVYALISAHFKMKPF